MHIYDEETANPVPRARRSLISATSCAWLSSAAAVSAMAAAPGCAPSRRRRAAARH